MRTFIISDIHGQTFWKEALRERRPEDRAVFLGDYFDHRGRGPFAKDQAENFREICAYARENPDTHLLLGNHDWHYTPWDEIGCSGRDDRNRPRYWEAMRENLSLLGMVYLDEAEAIIYSHAGVTKTWLEKVAKSELSKLNSLWKRDPFPFEFQMRGPDGEYVTSMQGDDVFQSPLWVRPQALVSDLVPGWGQVVGHTQVREPVLYPDSPVLLTCTLDGNIAVLDGKDPVPAQKPQETL